MPVRDEGKSALWDRMKTLFGARKVALPDPHIDHILEQNTDWTERVQVPSAERETFWEAHDHDLEEQNGWSRVKALFDVSDGKGPREEIQHIPTVVFATSVFAFLFGGQFGVRIAADYYKRHNQLTVFGSAMEAQRKYQSAMVLGFVKYGCRWGWRAGAFAGIYSLLLVVFETLRDKDDALNYAASGASTGALYNVLSGWRKMVVGVVVGGGLSLPVGVLAQLGNMVLPENYKLIKDKHLNKEEKQVEERQQWKQRLEETSSLIQALQEDIQASDTTDQTDHER